MNATLTNLPKPLTADGTSWAAVRAEHPAGAGRSLTGAVGVVDHRNVPLAVVLAYFRSPLATGSLHGTHSGHLRV